ncbi:MAG TPA: peptidoglycan editing factor PgeF [Candidatus Acidoferrales bacterium]
MPSSTKERSRPARKRSAVKPLARVAKSPWKLRRANGLQILQSPNLSQLNWLIHGFSTRSGGRSELPPGAGRKSPEDVLNLGFTDWDSREHVLANREKFFHSIGAAKMRALALRQIHSDIACGVTAANPQTVGNAPPKADALFTREPGVLLVVQTADCVPVLLADTKQHAIAAIHSGWRGTVQRIAQKTLGRMQMEFGTRPADVIAAIGPCIGQSCYEVGSDVAKEFHAQFPTAREWFDGPFDALAAGENDPNWLPWLTMRPPGHPPPPPTVQLDLVAANRAILVDAGVRAANISASGFCTACRTDLFFSYRRERTTGCMVAAIAIR